MQRVLGSAVLLKWLPMKRKCAKGRKLRPIAILNQIPTQHVHFGRYGYLHSSQKSADALRIQVGSSPSVRRGNNADVLVSSCWCYKPVVGKSELMQKSFQGSWKGRVLLRCSACLLRSLAHGGRPRWTPGYVLEIWAP